MVTSSYMHPESDRLSSGIGCDRCRPHAHMHVSSVGTRFATFMDASSQRRIRYVTHGNTGSPSQKQVSVSTDCGIGTMHNVAVVLHASMHNVQPVAMMASSEADEFARSGHCRFVSLPFWMVKASKRIPPQVQPHTTASLLSTISQMSGPSVHPEVFGNMGI